MPSRAGSKANNASGGFEAKLLQIGVLRPVQGIHMRTPKLMSVDLQQPDAGQNGVLNHFVEKQELRLELVRQPNDPRHQYSL
jgi:hypothetical protein